MRTRNFDVQNYLHTAADVVYYLQGAAELGDNEFLEVALANAAQALGVSADSLRIHGDSVQVLRTVEAVDASTGQVFQAQRWEELGGERR